MAASTTRQKDVAGHAAVGTAQGTFGGWARSRGQQGLLLALLAAAACSPPPRSPRDSLTAYRRAIADGDARQAYHLLSQDVRNRYSFEEFERALKVERHAFEAAIEGLADPSAEPLLTATLPLADGTQLVLYWEEGGWRLGPDAVELYPQDTPRRALESFRRALDRRNYEVLYRFLPEAVRGGVTAEQLAQDWGGAQRSDAARFAEALLLSLPTAHFEVRGDLATATFADGQSLGLTRELGTWRLLEFP